MKQEFPEAVGTSTLPNSGGAETNELPVDASLTEETFGFTPLELARTSQERAGPLPGAEVKYQAGFQTYGRFHGQLSPSQRKCLLDAWC